MRHLVALQVHQCLLHPFAPTVEVVVAVAPAVDKVVVVAVVVAVVAAVEDTDAGPTVLHLKLAVVVDPVAPIGHQVVLASAAELHPKLVAKVTMDIGFDTDSIHLANHL